MIFSQMLVDVAKDWQDKVMNAVNNILTPILVIACSVGMVWAIVVGIKMMKADDKTKRDEAKATLINIAISIVAIAVLIGLFAAMREWLVNDDGSAKVTGSDLGNLYKTNIGNSLSLAKQCVSMLVFKC